jgi:hypothetical protein
MTFNPSFCPNCGQARVAGAAFCAKCGHDMTAVSSGYNPGVPPPVFYPAATNQKKSMPIWKKVLLGVLSLIIVLSLLMLAAGTYSLYSRGNNSSPTSDFNANNIAYSVIFNQDYNALVSADNAAITQQNNSDSKTKITGINTRLALHRNFDTQLLAINWPSSRTAQQTAVLSADIALEQQLATMAVNTTNTGFYNTLNAGLIPLQQAFETAALNVINDITGSPAPSTGGGGNSGSGTNGGSGSSGSAGAGFPTNLPSGNYDISECLQVGTGWGNCKSGGVFPLATLTQNLDGYLSCGTNTTCKNIWSAFDGTSFTVTQTQTSCDPGSPCAKGEVLFRVSKVS